MTTLNTRRFSLVSEPTAQSYESLVRVAIQKCATVCLIVRPTITLGPAGREVLEVLKIHLVGRRSVSAWPGTKLLGAQLAELFEFKAHPDVAKVMIEAADGLFAWTQPGLPEDPTFLREDGTVWLASICHERDGYLELSDTEAQQLGKDWPSFLESTRQE